MQHKTGFACYELLAKESNKQLTLMLCKHNYEFFPLRLCRKMLALDGFKVRARVTRASINYSLRSSKLFRNFVFFVLVIKQSNFQGRNCMCITNESRSRVYMHEGGGTPGAIMLI